MPQTLLHGMKPGTKMESAPRVVISVEPDYTDSTTTSGTLDSDENKGGLSIVPRERRASAPSDGRPTTKRLSATLDTPKSARLEKHYKSPRDKTPKAKHKSTKTFLTVLDGSDSSQENTKRIRSASYAGDKRPRRSLLSRRHGTGQRLSSSEETLAFKKSSTFHEMHTNEDKVSLVCLSRCCSGRFQRALVCLCLCFLSVSSSWPHQKDRGR